MNKYDKMLDLNKKVSAEKIERARRAIYQMLDEGEKITVPRLMDKTGLSRGFFYKNPTVRKELDRALEQQVGLSDPRKTILDMAINNEIAVISQQLKKLQKEKADLEKENEKLKKALERKNRDLLRNL